jgi:hypothetical protein
VSNVKPKIHAYSVRYGFSQLLPVAADKAFDWCTDYQPYDLALMKETGRRAIRKLTKDAIVLTETTIKNKKTIKKTKLVRLNRAQLSWTNTHIAGPNLHSQFLYHLIPEGKNRCRLSFEGLLVCYSSRVLRKQQLKRIADEERLGDSTVWRNLADELRRETASHWK